MKPDEDFFNEKTTDYHSSGRQNLDELAYASSGGKSNPIKKERLSIENYHQNLNMLQHHLNLNMSGDEGDPTVASSGGRHKKQQTQNEANAKVALSSKPQYSNTAKIDQPGADIAKKSMNVSGTSASLLRNKQTQKLAENGKK